jgi:hypothetical protein
MDDPTPTADALSEPPLHIEQTRFVMALFFGLPTLALAAAWARSHWWANALYISLPCDYRMEVNADHEAIMFTMRWMPIPDRPFSLHECERIELSGIIFRISNNSGSISPSTTLSSAFPIGLPSQSPHRSRRSVPSVAIAVSPCVPFSSPRGWWPSCWGSASG